MDNTRDEAEVNWMLGQKNVYKMNHRGLKEGKDKSEGKRKNTSKKVIGIPKKEREWEKSNV